MVSPDVRRIGVRERQGERRGPALGAPDEAADLRGGQGHARPAREAGGGRLVEGEVVHADAQQPPLGGEPPERQGRGRAGPRPPPATPAIRSLCSTFSDRSSCSGSQVAVAGRTAPARRSGGSPPSGGCCAWARTTSPSTTRPPPASRAGGGGPDHRAGPPPRPAHRGLARGAQPGARPRRPGGDPGRRSAVRRVPAASCSRRCRRGPPRCSPAAPWWSGCRRRSAAPCSARRGRRTSPARSAAAAFRSSRWIREASRGATTPWWPDAARRAPAGRAGAGTALHRRASGWFARAGDPDAAARHARPPATSTAPRRSSGQPFRTAWAGGTSPPSSGRWPRSRTRRRRGGRRWPSPPRGAPWSGAADTAEEWIAAAQQPGGRAPAPPRPSRYCGPPPASTGPPGSGRRGPRPAQRSRGEPVARDGAAPRGDRARPGRRPRRGAGRAGGRSAPRRRPDARRRRAVPGPPGPAGARGGRGPARRRPPRAAGARPAGPAGVPRTRRPRWCTPPARWRSPGWDGPTRRAPTWGAGRPCWGAPWARGSRSTPGWRWRARPSCSATCPGRGPPARGRVDLPDGGPGGAARPARGRT